jgi:hypothetical protein
MGVQQKPSLCIREIQKCKGGEKERRCWIKEADLLNDIPKFKYAEERTENYDEFSGMVIDKIWCYTDETAVALGLIPEVDFD